MEYLPTLACARQLYMAEDVSELIKLGLTRVHVDIMDGHYVPNLSMSIDTCIQLKALFPALSLDVHLMVTEPFGYIERLAAAGVGSTAFHISATPFSLRTLRAIRAQGMQAGIVLNPSESPLLLEPLLGEFDYLVLMCVEPGFSGQAYLKNSYNRLAKVLELRDKPSDFAVLLDGGITPQIGKQLGDMGADGIVLGYPTIFNQPDGISAAWERTQCILNR